SPFSLTAPSVTTLIPLSLHAALPILAPPVLPPHVPRRSAGRRRRVAAVHRHRHAELQSRSETSRHQLRRVDDGELRRRVGGGLRSEEHTSELQSRSELVCRLLLVKKK